jgi:hypothetical protein
LTTRKPDITFEQMLNAMGDSLSDLASSEDQEVRENKDDEDYDTEHGNLSEDDKPGWVMGTISKMVQRRMDSIRQKQFRCDKLTQLGLRDIADYVCERDMKYGATEFKVPVVVKPQTDTTAATPSQTTFGELMQAFDIVPGQSPMPHVTFREGSSQMRLGSEEPQADNYRIVLKTNTEPNSSRMEIAKAFHHVTFHPCRECT